MKLTQEVIAKYADKHDWMLEINDDIERIKSINSDSGVMIGACKVLLESISKTILNKIDPNNRLLTSKSPTVDKLFMSAKDTVIEKINPVINDNQELTKNKKEYIDQDSRLTNELVIAAKDSIITKINLIIDDDEQKLIQSTVNMIGQINTLRNNRCRAAHGKLLPFTIQSSVQLANLTATVTDGLVAYLLHLFCKIDFSYNELIRYEDNKLFNDMIDEINIFNNICYSKALFDQDYTKYKAQLDDYKLGECIIFKCLLCGKEHYLWKDDLSFECVHSEEREMGSENYYECMEDISCACGNKISMKLDIYEYPDGVFNSSDTKFTGAELSSTFNLSDYFYNYLNSHNEKLHEDDRWNDYENDTNE